MAIIKIDFDNYIERIDELRECINAIPKPLYVRISSGRKGIHIMSFHEDDKGFREKYDDPIRVQIDRNREGQRLINNLLADVNSFGSERKVAGKWIKVENEKDWECFNKEVIMKEFNFICNKCKDTKTMKAKDEKATIGHPVCGGMFRCNSVVKKSKSESVSQSFKTNAVIPTPSETIPVVSKQIETMMETGQEYFHPKINLVEKFRCPTCYERKVCSLRYEEKNMCLMKFLLERRETSNPDVVGVLSLDPSEFRTIELEDIKQKIDLYDIVRLFINRDDKYSLQNTAKGTFPDKNKTLTLDILESSLEGEITIGTRPINSVTNKIKWICYDLDKDHNEYPRVVADAIVKYLREWYGLNGIIELSGSIDSYHVWIVLNPTDNNVAYQFDQHFRGKLRSIGIGSNPKSIERGVQLGDSGMVKLPYNIQNKEKHGHKGGRSRFVDGVDISKIIPENLPPPWGNSQISELNTFQPVIEEKIEPQKVSNILDKIIENHETVNGIIKCNKCSKPPMQVVQKHIDEVVFIVKNPHRDCGGKISFGLTIYETEIQILKNNTVSVRNFCERLMNSPGKKTEFDYEIRPTSYDNFENNLILKTKTEKDGKELAGWLVNSGALKEKLHRSAPEPFKVEKVYDFTIGFAEQTFP